MTPKIWKQELEKNRETEKNTQMLDPSLDVLTVTSESDAQALLSFCHKAELFVKAFLGVKQSLFFQPSHVPS